MDTKNQQNHFNNPVVIILTLILVGIGGYFLLTKKSNISQDNIPNPQQAEIDTLKKTVEDLKNQKPQTIIKEIPNSAPDIAKIVNQWRPRIARIECKWYSVNGSLLHDLGGSGVLLPETDGTYGLITNKHVVSYNDNGPGTCDIMFPGSKEVYTVKADPTGMTNSDISWSQANDYGNIFISNPTPYIKSIAGKYGGNFPSCLKKASIGNQVLILGYPNIGSVDDITATEGIISGYDGDYYITSAKVEHGNSGGAAILVKDDCYLGIPSFVDPVELESLARILMNDKN